MSSSLPDCAIRFKNNTVTVFKLFDVEIQPPSAGDLPPKDFKLLPGAEYILGWQFKPDNPEQRFVAFGSIRFWPGDKVFGVKLEEDAYATVIVPSLLRFFGDPSAGHGWSDVTMLMDLGSTFKIKSGNITEYYLTLKSAPERDRRTIASRLVIDATIDPRNVEL